MIFTSILFDLYPPQTSVHLVQMLRQCYVIFTLEQKPQPRQPWCKSCHSVCPSHSPHERVLAKTLLCTDYDQCRLLGLHRNRTHPIVTAAPLACQKSPLAGLSGETTWSPPGSISNLLIPPFILFFPKTYGFIEWDYEGEFLPVHLFCRVEPVLDCACLVLCVPFLWPVLFLVACFQKKAHLWSQFHGCSLQQFLWQRIQRTQSHECND